MKNAESQSTSTAQSIGAIIRERFNKMPRSCTVSWFARELNCDRTNVYDIFSRNSIDTSLLMRICRILDYNFFEVLSQNFEAERNSEAEQSELD